MKEKKKSHFRNDTQVKENGGVDSCSRKSLEKGACVIAHVCTLGRLSSAQQRVMQLSNAQSQSALLKPKSVNQTIDMNHFVPQ